MHLSCEVFLLPHGSKGSQLFKTEEENKVVKFLALATGIASTIDISFIELLGSDSSSQTAQSPSVDFLGTPYTACVQNMYKLPFPILQCKIILSIVNGQQFCIWDIAQFPHLATPNKLSIPPLTLPPCWIKIGSWTHINELMVWKMSLGPVWGDPRQNKFKIFYWAQIKLAYLAPLSPLPQNSTTV